MNECFSLCCIPLNQVRTALVFFHWFKWKWLTIDLLIRSSSKSRGGFWNMHLRSTPPLTGATYASGRSTLLFASLIKRNEPISSCRHAGKCALKILSLRCFSFLCVFQVVFCFLLAFVIASLVTPYILFLKKLKSNENDQSNILLICFACTTL